MSDTQVSGRREIVFGEAVPLPSAVSILSSAFPDARTIHWTPKHSGWAGRSSEVSPEDVSLVVAQEVLLATGRHVSQTVARELGGFLLGNRYRCPSGRNYVIIDQFVEAEHTESDAISLHFTHETWRRLDDQLNTTFLGKALVGWYHSHPRMDVFLSQPDDLSIHERRFPEPWQCALVLEPDKHLGGFFCRRGGELDTKVPVDFYELLRNDTRQTVIAWENYSGLDILKNVRPHVARLNTKTVHAPPDVPSPVPPLSRERPWAIIGLTVVACLSAALYISTRAPGGQTVPAEPTPTATAQVQPQLPEGPSSQPEQSRETPQANPTATKSQATADKTPQEPRDARKNSPAVTREPARDRRQDEARGNASDQGPRVGTRRVPKEEPKPKPKPPTPKPTPIIN